MANQNANTQKQPTMFMTSF